MPTLTSHNATVRGIPVNMATMRLTPRHYWIVGVSSLGQFIGTAVATIAGIIIPMLNIVLHPGLSSLMQGVIGSIDLAGICIGSIVFGKLSDRYGYLPFFRLCPALIAVSAAAAALLPGTASLTVALFLVGVGIGGEYSLDSDYVTDLMPDRYKSLMVGVTKTASAAGNIVAAAIGFWMLISWKDAAMWPRLMWVISITGVVMLLLRIRFYESPGWLLSKGRKAEAEEAARKFLGNDVYIDTDVATTAVAATSGSAKPWAASSENRSGLFRFIISDWKKVVLSGIPWACEGLGVYGIGVFLPILVMALGLEPVVADEAPVLHVADSVEVTLYISCIMLPGFIAGLILINKGRRLTAIQTWGFLLCAVSLAILMPAYHEHWNKWIAIGAFMMFEFFLNMGPHLITYVLPPKIYAVAERGQGVGIAAAIGKIGAVAGVFLIPVLLHAGGAMLVLGVCTGVMAVGAAVTFLFRDSAASRI